MVEVEGRGVEGEENFRELMREIIGEDASQLPEDWVKTAELLRKTAREVLGVTTGQRNEDKETWWWNEIVQECVKKKRETKKNWNRLQNEASKKWYKEMREATKREVARAKEHAYEELYDKWKLRRVRRSCTDWQSRENGQGRMSNW